MQCKHAFVGVCLEEKNMRKKIIDKNRNKTHQQCLSSSHTSPTLYILWIVGHHRVVIKNSMGLMRNEGFGPWVDK